MKKALLHATLVAAAFLFVPALHAITEREGFEVTDFPNTAAAVTATYTYTLTTGGNTFQGSLPFGSGDADYFKIVVPAGMRITQITLSTNPSGFTGSFTVPSTPVNAGTYTISFAGQFLQTENWSVVFTLAAVPDFDVTTSGGVMTVTDNTNQNNTLTLSEPSNGSIKFAAASRTFSVNNGGYTTGDSGSVSLSGINSVVVNAGNGNDIINVSAFANSSFPSLSLKSGTGPATVNLNGNITFASNNSLTIDSTSSSAGTVTATGAQLIASGNGQITIKCSKNVSLSNGAVLQSVDGSIDVEANQQTPATTGNFTGVNLDGSGTKIQKTGMNLITVKGVGGNDPGGGQLGVGVFNGAQILVTTIGSYAGINVTGVGGASAGPVNRGVTVYGSGSGIITSGGAAQTVNGTGGASSSAYGIGVSVLYGGQITGVIGGTFSGAMTVTGVGAGASGGSSNLGVEVAETGSQIAHSDQLSVIATSGPGSSVGLDVYHSASITSNYGGVSISADSIAVDNTANVSSVSYLGFSPAGMATQVDLGGAAGFSNALVITNTELTRFSAPQFDFSSPSDLTISAPLSLPAGTNVYLVPTGAIHATANGADVSVGTGAVNLGDGFFTFPTFSCPITGPAADSGYPELNVAGNIALRNATLSLAGTTYAGAAGNQFTIVKNSGSGTTTNGTFANLPEGAYLVWPGNAALAAQISYVGGASGHDVVLTLVPVANALRVTTTADDTGIGSLPTVLAFAAAHSGGDTITFDPTLGGQTITLTGPANGYAITLGDASPVTIDASSLTNGLTIQGAGANGSFGLFQVNLGSSLTLRGLTLVNGGGSAFAAGGGVGGAILNSGVLTVVGCTFAGNYAEGGGAITSNGTLTLMQCTFAGNSTTDLGGNAIFNFGSLAVTQCTISNNFSARNGGAIRCEQNGNLTLTNSIVAGNTASDPGTDILSIGLGPVLTVSGTNIVQSIAGLSQTGSGTIINADPLLVSLGSYGGPTNTMIPKLGSPAIDHGSNASVPNDPATGLPFTTDQRGKTRIQNGSVDIGAVETTALQVTTAADDGSAGSLRQVVNQATDVANTVTFAPALSGLTIPLNNIGFEISLSSNVAIDASSLPGGMTISGGGSTRIFTTNSPTTIVLTNLTLTGGNGAGALSTGSGGAIYNNGATLTLNECTLINNSCGASAIGGAIRNAPSATAPLTLYRCTVANNTAASGNVGGVACAAAPTTINLCTFYGNSSAGTGGALSLANGGSGSLAVTQSTIAGNHAVNGGGIDVVGASGTLTIRNSIVATNTASASGADIANNGSLNLLGVNIIEGITGSITSNSGILVNADPLLAPLDNYGGPTKTMALLLGSPAKNPPTSSPFATDQRGFVITDGMPDVGAYEAGDVSNFNAWIYENLPASTATNAAVHATTYDYDGDGVTNFNEWLLLTNPSDPNSYLHITQTSRSGSNFSITFPSVLGRHYTVEGCTDLVSWMMIDGPLSGTGSSITRSYIIPVGTTPKYFLRVRGGP